MKTFHAALLIVLLIILLANRRTLAAYIRRRPPRPQPPTPMPQPPQPKPEWEQMPDGIYYIGYNSEPTPRYIGEVDLTKPPVEIPDGLVYPDSMSPTPIPITISNGTVYVEKEGQRYYYLSGHHWMRLFGDAPPTYKVALQRMQDGNYVLSVNNAGGNSYSIVQRQ